MRLLDSFRERKFTSKSLDRFDPLISEITFAFQDRRVIEKIADITGIKDAVGDPHLLCGGISSMRRRHFLNPHIDNSHDGDHQNYSVLNLLYYVSPDWLPRNGGSLELWDEKVITPIEIPSLFNRLVLMSTNDRSWHSVNKVRSKASGGAFPIITSRHTHPTATKPRMSPIFMARPEQKILRAVTKLDSELRTKLRKIKKKRFQQKGYLHWSGQMIARTSRHLKRTLALKDLASEPAFPSAFAKRPSC